MKPAGEPRQALPPAAKRRRRSVTRAAREEFLQALREGWSVTHAAERATVGRERLYELAREDAEFQDQWREALDAGTDLLEDELHRKALKGWMEEVRGPSGEVIRTTQRWTPQALITALKGRRPEKYADGGTHVAIVNTVPHRDESRRMDVDLQEVAQIMRECGLSLPTGYGEVVEGDAIELRDTELEPGPAVDEQPIASDNDQPLAHA